MLLIMRKMRLKGVFPSDEAIKSLEEFTEDMPDVAGDAPDILAQLHKYGSRAGFSE